MLQIEDDAQRKRNEALDAMGGKKEPFVPEGNNCPSLLPLYSLQRTVID
jgi:hypothetical protein